MSWKASSVNSFSLEVSVLALLSLLLALLSLLLAVELDEASLDSDDEEELVELDEASLDSDDEEDDSLLSLESLSLSLLLLLLVLENEMLLSELSGA